MKTHFIGFEYQTQVDLMINGIQIDDADLNMIVDATVTVHDTRDTGGRKNEVFVETVKTGYVVEIDEDVCLEVFGHAQNVFKVTRDQILNHPDMDEMIQDYATENL